MSLLHEPGDLARTPVAALLLEALNRSATGVLAVKHGGAESRVFLRDGVPVGAQTYAAFKPLGQVLLAARLIDMDALAASLAEMARTGRPQGAVLVEMGVVTQEQVDRALSEQQAGYLTLVAGVGEGTYAFEAKPVPEWTRGIRIAPLRAIVQALEQPQARALVSSALDPVATPIQLAAGYARLAEAFGWSVAEAALVGRLQSLTRLEDFFRDPGVPPGRARAMLAALLLLGGAAGPGAGEAVPNDAVRELAELAGETLDLELEPIPDDAPSPVAAAAPVRAETPEARERRQRLLQRAIQNMGVSALSRPGAATATATPASTPTATAAPASTPTGGTAATGASRWTVGSAGTATHAAPAQPARPPASPQEAELRAALAAILPRAKDPDLCARLGVAGSATKEEVKSAYFQLAKRFHPDRFAAPALADLQRTVHELFGALNEAYEILSDDRRRREWTESRGPRSDPSGAALDFQKAEACLRTRDLKRARGFYESAVRGDPSSLHLAGLAGALLADGNPAERERAKQLATLALRDPRCARGAYVAGMLAKLDGNDVAAERHFRSTLAAEPGHAEAQKELRAIEAKKARRERPRD